MSLEGTYLKAVGPLGIKDRDGYFKHEMVVQVAEETSQTEPVRKIRTTNSISFADEMLGESAPTAYWKDHKPPLKAGLMQQSIAEVLISINLETPKSLINLELAKAEIAQAMQRSRDITINLNSPSFTSLIFRFSSQLSILLFSFILRYQVWICYTLLFHLVPTALAVPPDNSDAPNQNPKSDIIELIRRMGTNLFFGQMAVAVFRALSDSAMVRNLRKSLSGIAYIAYHNMLWIIVTAVNTGFALAYSQLLEGNEHFRPWVFVSFGLWLAFTPIHVYRVYYAYNLPQRSQYLLWLGLQIWGYIHAISMAQNLGLQYSLPYVFPCIAFGSMLSSLLVDVINWETRHNQSTLTHYQGYGRDLEPPLLPQIRPRAENFPRDTETRRWWTG